MVNGLLEDFLGEVGLTRKEKRNGKQNETGTVQPKHSGRRRLHARQTQPGNTLEDVSKSKGLKIAFASFGRDGLFWNVEMPIVYLNQDSPAIDHRNELAVMGHAIHAAANYLVLSGKSDMFPCLREGDEEFKQVARLTGYLMSRIQSPVKSV